MSRDSSRPRVSVALAGNPNSGKSSLFNAITGARQHVGNYPGVTVEKKEGVVEVDGVEVHVVDLPGTYSLTAYSIEELVARNYIIGQRPDVVVDVVDASNLERHLYLAVQLMELGVPVVIALNMVDVAEQRGLKVDARRLEELLGVAVVPTVARTGRGVKELLRRVVEVAREGRGWRPLVISYGPDVDQGLEEIAEILRGGCERQGLLSARWLALKCLEGDREVLASVEADPALAERLLPVCRRVTEHIRSTLDDDPEGVIADYRYGFITAIARQVLTQRRAQRLDVSDKIDKVLTNRFAGPLVLLLVLYGIYEFVFSLSEVPVGWMEAGFGWLASVAWEHLPAGLLRSLVVSGVIEGVGGVLGFVPLIMFMFLAIAFMEDSGYMARVAYLMDRLLRAFGLHGNSVLPLIVAGGISGGCAVPAVMATRTLKDPKARIATIMVVPFMNCGAKLPVYGVLVAAFFADRQAAVMFALTLVAWAMALVGAKVLRVSVLRGRPAPFVMELPPYRTPTLKGLAIHTWERTWQYIKKAGTVILAISVIMWAMMSLPMLPRSELARWQARMAAAPSAEARAELAAALAERRLEHSIAGRIGRWLGRLSAPLGFDWRTNVALIGGFAAKEVIVSTMATAYSLGETSPEAAGSLARRLKAHPGWNPLKALAFMLFVMLYSPCAATVAVMRKETGSWRWPALAVAYSLALAYLVALGVYQGGRVVGLG